LKLQAGRPYIESADEAGATRRTWKAAGRRFDRRNFTRRSDDPAGCESSVGSDPENGDSE